MSCTTIIKSFRFLLISFSCILHAHSLSAQAPIFNHLNVEQGLSQNSVLAIVQDKNGFMWFGTRHGLNRYDGHNFRIYQKIPGNSPTTFNDYITALFRDSKGELWVKAVDGSLYKYNEAKDNFDSIVDQSKKAFITCIYEDQQQNIWIGGLSGGLFKLVDRKKNTFRSPLVSGWEMQKSNIRCIYRGSDGLLWVGTTTGLIQLRPKNNGTFDYRIYKHDSSLVSISEDIITSIVEDKQKNIWVATQDNGLNLFNSTTGIFTRFSVIEKNEPGLVSNKIRKIICDKTGKLWIGTQDGISILDPTNKTFINCRHDFNNKESLSQNSIYSLFEDALGTVWIGTYFGGVNFTYSHSTPFLVWRDNQNTASFKNNVVSGIVEDARHNLWIGTEGGGINYLDRTTNVFSVYKNNPKDSTSLGSNLIKTLFLDKDQNLWIGTHGSGLNVLPQGSKKFRHYFLNNDNESEITCVFEDNENRFWVGGQRGLKKYKRDNIVLKAMDTIQLQLFDNKLVTRVFEDDKKNVWIGTNQGCFKLAYGETQFKECSKDYVNCINQDTHGNIWVGLHYNGVAMYNEKNNRWIRFSTKEGLADDNVVGILGDDKNNLWISTGNGLSRLDRSTNRFQNFNVSDGLAGNDFNTYSYFKDKSGNFFFGGYNGLTSFIPEKIKVNDYNAPIVFTGLKLFNNDVTIDGKDNLLRQNISLTPQLIFKYDQNVFTIEYVLLNFIKSGKNKYAYKLEGFDKDWNETANTFSTYTNLPSGNYIFWVKGANNDGMWGQPISIKIKILPPFWLTWWAYCLYAVIFAAVLFFIIRFFFLRALIKREDDLHQMKLNFFTNISHEIRTHLTLIMAPAEKMLQIKDEQGLFRQQAELIKSNSSRLLRLVSELMDFRKAETNHLKLQVGKYDFISFLQEIFEVCADLSFSKNIHTSFNHNTDTLLLYFDKAQLEKVFFNLLANAFKFTLEDGSISMNVEETKDTVCVKVKDNGLGIAPEYLKNLFTNYFQVADHGLQNTGYGIGLALTKNIIELHNGRITVESRQATNEQRGETCFSVTLLKGDMHFKNKGYDVKNVVDEVDSKIEIASSTILDPVINNHSEQETVQSQHKPTIMIVEDTPELTMLIKDVLEKKYRIISYEDGLKGWNAAIEEIPDLVVSDVMMPQMDGFELCRKLKSDERTSHIPVILLTAKSTTQDQVSGLEMGADMYITKPFSTKVLELNVRNIFASRERMRTRFQHEIMMPETQLVVKTATSLIEEEVVDDEASELSSIDKEFLRHVTLLVDEHMYDPQFSAVMLASKVGMSQAVLYKKIMAISNMTLNDFIKLLRLKKAAELLKEKRLSVADISFIVGYSDRRYFSREFKKQFGILPSEYMSE